MIQSRYGYTARFDGQKRLIIAALTGEMEIEQALSQLDTEINQSLSISLFLTSSVQEWQPERRRSCHQENKKGA